MIAGRHVSSITNIATANQERLVIVGATGMVGGYALRYALENPAVASVTAIGRKTVGISHPKLKEVLHRDFADCSGLADALSVKMQPSFAWAHIQARCQTRSSAG
jgi:hypothetical protein